MTVGLSFFAEFPRITNPKPSKCCVEEHVVGVVNFIFPWMAAQAPLSFSPPSIPPLKHACMHAYTHMPLVILSFASADPLLNFDSQLIFKLHFRGLQIEWLLLGSPWEVTRELLGCTGMVERRGEIPLPLFRAHSTNVELQLSMCWFLPGLTSAPSPGQRKEAVKKEPSEQRRNRGSLVSTVPRTSVQASCLTTYTFPAPAPGQLLDEGTLRNWL